MSVFTISDGTTDIRAVIFPKNYQGLKPMLVAGKLLFVRGRLEKDNKQEYSFSISDIKNV